MPIIEVSESWVNFIEYCRNKLPYGDIKIRIVNGNPTKRLSEDPEVRFDKSASIPKD